MAKTLKNKYGVDEKQKCYLARVEGNFPHEEFDCDSPIYCVSAKKSEYDVYNKDNHNNYNPGKFPLLNLHFSIHFKYTKFLKSPLNQPST